MNELVIVDFWAPWCGPCRMMAPVIEEAIKKYNGKVKLVKVNVDESTELVSKYQIKSIPTLVFLQKDEVVNMLSGARTQSDIESNIERFI